MDPAVNARGVRGYTLVEVLVAVVILGLVLPGLTYMVIGSRKSQVSSYRMEQGAAYGQLVIDSLSILPRAARSQVNMACTASIGGIDYVSNWTYSDQGAASVVADTVRWLHGVQTEFVVIRGVVR